ncbi:hypothetical protein [Mycobacterium malmoense]|uniref:hypothetical protein n=1 Tax=Mycobacterium malmoense TaxID=1780 RepID=UPI0008F92F7C|nr:hypothetical protein [Mycobacterium malmoense]OIN80876.1 hypothetical protein BMG05_11115 [Mycobacterium malmoense]
MTAPQTPTPLVMPGAQAGIQAVQAQAVPVVQAQGGVVPPPAGQPQAPQPMQPTPDAPQAPPPVAPQPAQPTQQQPAQQPPWGDATNFDPDRAWRLIENLRDELKTYKERTDPIVAEHETQRRAALDESARLKEDLSSANTQLDAWRSNAVRATAESMAASRFIDADAALALVGDLDQFAAQGRVDTDKLTSAFDQLATSKPHLVAQQQQSQGFTVNRGQGASGTSVSAAQVANSRASQGDWKGSLAAKVQMLSELPRQ